MARCRGRTKRGQPCKRQAISGATVCPAHGAAAPQVKAKAAIRAELAAWGVVDEKVDPSEVLMRLLAQAYRRANIYAAELQNKVKELGLEDATIGAAFGEGGQVGEYIRGLAQLEADERDRAANFARIAIAAGLEERRVRLAEEESARIADVLQALFADPEFGLTVEQQRNAPSLMRRHLSVVA